MAVKLWEKETEEGWEGAVGMLVREGVLEGCFVEPLLLMSSLERSLAGWIWLETRRSEEEEIWLMGN